MLNSEQKTQTLFWSDPHIIPPERPKRMVKKVVEGWVNLYPGNECSSLHETSIQANISAGSERLGPACKIYHEYLSEE